MPKKGDPRTYYGNPYGKSRPKRVPRVAGRRPRARRVSRKVPRIKRR